LLIVSLPEHCAALGNYLNSLTASAPRLLAALNTLISLRLFTLLFAAIYKVLPDTPISWREVGIGALLTAVLLTVGEALIGWYLGTTAASSGYGTARALVLVLLWAYYCAQIFLFGAELTRAIAGRSAKAASAPHKHASHASPRRRPGLEARKLRPVNRKGSDF
jgi:membrane protein